MKKIIINGTKIEVILENDYSFYGEYYIKNNELFLKAKTALDLAQLMKYKKEIKKELKGND